MSCDDCFRAVKHEGTPQGKIEKIGGVDCYIATPPGEFASDKAVLFLTDVFGMPYINNKLLADSFAENGFKTIVLDYLNGDPYPEDFGAPGKVFDRDEWKSRHTRAETRPPLDRAIAGLKEQGINQFATTGYCFGARYAVDLAVENVSKVMSFTHPGFLETPADFEALKARSNNPLLLNTCEFDPPFPPSAQETVDKLLGDGQHAPGYERTYWPQCKHGFAVRGDMTDPMVKAGKEGAFKATVEFFKKHL